MQTPLREFENCQFIPGKQRANALFTAVLCSTVTPAPQDFCNEGDVDRC
jgi:hypothetical protein